MPTDRQFLLEVFNSALAAVDPCNAVLEAVKVECGQLRVAASQYNLADFERIIVVGAGKATARMALAIESLLGEKIDAGLIIVKDGHTVPLSIVEQVESSHPVPGAAGVVATRRMLELVRDASEKTLIICLLSGGASALLVSPVEAITLQDKQDITRLLLNAGASIGELNTVRKHLSAVKGGRLAQAAFPARLLTLILSDVIGDALEVIASGPTAPDPGTFAEAMTVIGKFGLEQAIPARVLDYLQRGSEGMAQETVKENAPCFAQTQNVIVGSLQQALQAAREHIAQAGFAGRIISSSLQGEARDAARILAQAARAELALMQEHERRYLICGGETTVTVHGNGKGGRNQELALAFALEMAGMEGVTLLSAATDGTDGPTEAAGAIVNGETASVARGLGLDPQRYLDSSDSYSFFKQLDELSELPSHFIPGPTGTNVMDIQLVHLARRLSSAVRSQE